MVLLSSCVLLPGHTNARFMCMAQTTYSYLHLQYTSTRSSQFVNITVQSLGDSMPGCMLSGGFAGKPGSIHGVGKTKQLPPLPSRIMRIDSSNGSIQIYRDSLYHCTLQESSLFPGESKRSIKVGKYVGFLNINIQNTLHQHYTPYLF